MNPGNKATVHDWFRAIASSVVTGVIFALGVAISTGKYIAKLENHEIRIATLEAAGSPSFREHYKLDDQRELVIVGRLTKLEKWEEDSSKFNSQIESRLAAIETELRILNQRLKQ